jgi:tRNA(Ser,Leu) C12 N-acetylase TAN1
MAEADLIVTFDPSHAGSAKEEVNRVLKEVKKEAKHLKSEIDGLFKLKIGNSKDVVKSLKKLHSKKPDLFERTCHWTPIEKWCKSSVKDMQKTVKKMQEKIKKTDKWKMELTKRHYPKSSTVDLILKLTEVVDKPKVDLKKPKKIIQVEVMGNKAGLSLLGTDELLNTLKGKKK